MMSRIVTIIDKEWAEVFHNPMVLFTIVLPPLIFTAIPLIMLGVMANQPNPGAVTDMPAEFTRVCGSLEGFECTQVYLINQFMMLFMVLPLAIPAAIAAYSIVGEKTTHCLEPLLATPIRTAELIAGKVLSAVIPAVLATWAGFVVFAVGARLIAADPRVAARVVDPQWVVAVLLLGPLMALSAVSVSVIVSSRVSDPRTAEQVSMVVLIPLMGVFFAQTLGIILIDLRAVLLAAVVLAAVDVGLVYLAAQLFQRETILTRWK
jgi:ABC-2 type transport system permease protein